MDGTYQELQEKGRNVFRGGYCLHHYGCNTAFCLGAIRCVWVDFTKEKEHRAVIQVAFANGEVFTWKTKWIDGYTSQFGCAVSLDGTVYTFSTS